MKLNYSTSGINRNFKIKVFGIVNGKKVNTLVGVSGLLRLLDGAVDLMNRLLDRAFSGTGDKCVCKLRRGLNEAVNKVKLPKLSERQYGLLCECIRYRAADNQKECADARSRGQSTQWYDAVAKELNELKDIIYNLK